MATGDGAGGKAGADKQRLTILQETGKSNLGFSCFIYCFVLGQYLAELWGPNVVPGIELGLSACRVTHFNPCTISLYYPKATFFVY